MINICHPKIHGKPPAKSVADRKDVRGEDNRMETKKEDHNRNIVESSSVSFEQLCKMINGIEKSIMGDDGPQLEPEKDHSGQKGSTGTTYEDIMSFLAKLEEGTLDETKANVPEVDTDMLQEIFEKSQPFDHADCDPVLDSTVFPASQKIANPAFEEDLSTARLQLEERNATIALLKEQLKSERKLACEKLDSERNSGKAKLQAQEEKYKSIVKRHQKFIQQLITEKTELTEKCNCLVHKIKDIQVKTQRDLRAVADRHTVELQRAREHCAAAEKIKRERWIEARTTKIKEMTVKGLEPELRKMMDQHSEEIQNLRNVHMKELQDTELRLIRRSNQQLEQLRLELTGSHERMLADEKSILWARYKEKLDEQENRYKEQQLKLMEELQAERGRFSEEQAKLVAENETKSQRWHQRCQEEVQALEQRHLNEKKALEESLKAEWEAWIADYKRQQSLKLEKAENSVRDECNRERDRQIELAIQRLEKDSREAKLNLQQHFDCKLRSLQENFEIDLQTAIEKEQLYKAQTMRCKDKLEKTEFRLQKTEKRLQECTIELNSANEMVNKLSFERDNAKQLARQDIEGEKRELEEKVGSLYQEIARNNANRDTSMAQLHSRIKLIMTQKILTIKNLTRQLSSVETKCEHLEKLLDQQRKEYILKSL